MFYYGIRLKIHSFAIPIYHLCYYITYIDPHKRIKASKLDSSLPANGHRIIDIAFLRLIVLTSPARMVVSLPSANVP